LGGVIIANPIPEEFLRWISAIDRPSIKALAEMKEQGLPVKSPLLFLLARGR